MFTGIIQEIGEITEITKKQNQKDFTVHCQKILKKKKIGDSIAVNGACMTVTNLNRQSFSFRASEESLSKTNLDLLKTGHKVNLEPALRLQDTIDGHLVTGHIDCIAELFNIKHQQNDWLYEIKFPKAYSKFIAEKGSVTLNGISLTVVEKKEEIFTVNIIPHTLENTNLQFLKKSAKINLEIDLMARYLINFHENK